MLTEIYGASAVPRVWTTGFVKGAENWFGGRGFDRLASVDPAEGDFYFCIGLLGDAETRRSTSGIEEQPVLICDDIGTKVSVAAWDEVLNRGFPPPHFRVETSPGNQTWVWVLDRPVSRSEPDHWEDLARLRAWLVAKDLTDDVMDASRYVRLPMGVNSTAQALVLSTFESRATSRKNPDRIHVTLAPSKTESSPLASQGAPPVCSSETPSASATAIISTIVRSIAAVAWRMVRQPETIMAAARLG